ncbi:MAG: hypothetical protein AAF589_08775 [Planctomycetota bacterium]
MRRLILSLMFLVAGIGTTVGCGDGGASTAPAAATPAADAEPAAEGSGAAEATADEEGSGAAE